jgi:lysophospholipase L1-like esterase
MAGDSTMSVKAKAAYPETGWGMPFVEFWNDQVQVASTEQVVLIDHDSLSMAVYGKIGVEPSKLLFLHLQPGEYPNYPAGKEDNTHFNELGARLMPQLVLQEIRLKIPELANYIYSQQNSKS